MAEGGKQMKKRTCSGLCRYKKEIFWTALTLLYLLFIYSKSMRPAVESSNQSQGLLKMIEKAFPFIVHTLGLTEHVLRKMAHFGEYLILGMLLAQTVKVYGFFLVGQLWLVPLSGFLMASVDEGIQLFTEGRSCQLSDVMLDLCGVITGLLIWRFIRFFRRNNPKR